MPDLLGLNNLLDLLETAEIDLKRFALWSHRYYREFAYPKKSGGLRMVVAPSLELKTTQRRIAEKILKQQHLSESCTGFREGRSIVSNALPHVGQDFVLNLDIKDFFPSISLPRVAGLFRSIGFDDEAARLLARLTTFKGLLPQGAPTSPHIANLICRKLDRRLLQFSKLRNWNYTRYCDDITFSGSGNPASAMSTIAGIIESEGFAVNDEKTRIRLKHQRQFVTGIVVNEKISIPRQERRLLRAMCHHLRCDPESFRGVSDHLLGQLSFAHMVEGILDKAAYQESRARILEYRKMARQAGSVY